MQIHAIPRSQIQIPKDRQRRTFSDESIIELAESIMELGLIHPPVVRKEASGCFLVAGERRLKAMEYCWMFGKQFKVGGELVLSEYVPCQLLSDLTDLEAFAIELDENIKREDLSITDRATAISQLMLLRTRQSIIKDEPVPTIETLAREVYGIPPEKAVSGSGAAAVRANLMIARNANDPDVKKAKSVTEAVKIIKRKEELKRSSDLAVSVGRTFTNDIHQLLHTDCLKAFKLIAPETYDVILSDPPYGMGADEFGDSGGKAQGSHFYEDSYESWQVLMLACSQEFKRVLKPNAHLYLFCDIGRFEELSLIMRQADFKVFRTPFIWFNPRANRLPWIDSGPQRKWQAILYAVKGTKQVRHIRGDVLAYTSDVNLNHQAQKPVALYQDLLERSCLPGDYVLDPFCGTGPIFSAAHALKIRADGFEQDQAAYGIALQRIKDLK